MCSAPVLLTPERLAALPQLSSKVAFASEHGQRQHEWSGPLLWSVLESAGPIRPQDAVRMTLRVTGADGYSAVIALGELSAEFENKPVLLAVSADEARYPGQAMRLTVPGERRGGPSVRDVVRIDVE